MTTIDDVKERVFKAAEIAYMKIYRTPGASYRDAIKAVLDAADREMWVDVTETPVGQDVLISDGKAVSAWGIDSDNGGFVPGPIINSPTHFRPIPQPPEVKHEPD